MLKLTLHLIRRRSDWFMHQRNVARINENISLLCSHFITDQKESKFKRFEEFIFNSSLYLNSRNYSKSRNIKRERKKVIRVDENELNEHFDVEKLMSDIKKPLEIFKEKLVQHATLRTSVGAIENLKIQYSDKMYTIQDLAEIGKKNPKLFVLDFSLFPDVIPKVLETFQTSELNINVQQDGTRIYVPIPKVTKEYRETLAKKCKSYFLKCKESIREVQMKYIKSLKNIEKLPIDEKSRLTDQLTALGDQQISVAEGILKAKQDELLKTDEAV